MAEGLQGLGVEVRHALSFGRAALDHSVDLIPYSLLDLSIIVIDKKVRGKLGSEASLHESIEMD